MTPERIAELERLNLVGLTKDESAECLETIKAQAIAIDQLRAADKEIERLKKIIANAPHSYGCALVDPYHGECVRCDCWKKDAL